MAQIVNKKVKLDLLTVNGNAYALMGAFRKRAQREKWTREEINKVLDECLSGNYDHLVSTLWEHCDDSDDTDIDFEEENE